MKGPLKGSSLNELIELIESGETYVYVQSRDHPEGEIRGQIQPDWLSILYQNNLLINYSFSIYLIYKVVTVNRFWKGL